MTWVGFSFITSLCITFLIVSYKQLISVNGLHISTICFWVNLFTLPLFAMDTKLQGKNLLVDLKFIFVFWVLGIIFFICGTSQLKAISMAPNPGYCDAIILLKIVFISLISFFAFGSDLSIKKIVGCLFCILGSIIVSI